MQEGYLKAVGLPWGFKIRTNLETSARQAGAQTRGHASTGGGTGRRSGLSSSFHHLIIVSNTSYKYQRWTAPSTLCTSSLFHRRGRRTPGSTWRPKVSIVWRLQSSQLKIAKHSHFESSSLDSLGPPSSFQINSRWQIEFGSSNGFGKIPVTFFQSAGCS